nr:GTPase domain-containing protein [Acetobacter syzygii]
MTYHGEGREIKMTAMTLAKNIVQMLVASGFELAVTYLPDIWEKIEGFWNNNTLAVIGPTACGKDSLIARLQGKPVPDIHINTGIPEAVESYWVKYDDGNGKRISFQAKKTLNVGGEEPDRDEYWGDVCKKANVIFYMLDAEKLVSTQAQTISRLNNDMRWLVSEIGGSKFPKVVIVLNKFDILLEGEESPDVQEAIKNIALPLLKIVSESAKKSLGTRKDALKGVKPLSTTDDYLFAQLFPPVLRAAVS